MALPTASFQDRVAHHPARPAHPAAATGLPEAAGQVSGDTARHTSLQTARFPGLLCPHNPWTPLSTQYFCNTIDLAGLALQELDFEHQEACARHSPGQRNDRAPSPKDDPDALHAQFARAQQIILLDAVRTRFPAPASPAAAKPKGACRTVRLHSWALLGLGSRGSSACLAPNLLAASGLGLLHIEDTRAARSMAQELHKSRPNLSILGTASGTAWRLQPTCLVTSGSRRCAS